MGFQGVLYLSFFDICRDRGGNIDSTEFKIKLVSISEPSRYAYSTPLSAFQSSKCQGYNSNGNESSQEPSIHYLSQAIIWIPVPGC
jgi:hypothetical protein